MYFFVVHLYSHLYVVVVPRTRVWLCLNFDQVCCCFFDLHRPSRANPPPPLQLQQQRHRITRESRALPNTPFVVSKENLFKITGV